MRWAISDIFGTNLFYVTIIVLVYVLHPGGPVLLEAGPFAASGALLALVLTVLFIVGMWCFMSSVDLDARTLPNSLRHAIRATQVVRMHKH